MSPVFPWLRFLRVLAARLLRRRPMGARDESVLHFRVWPGDIDFNLHLNDGRYLSLMDLGRLDLIVRTGIYRVMRREKWFPVVGAVLVSYKREVRAFRRFALKSRIIGWDAKWFYLEQRIYRGETLACEATLQTLFRGRDGNVPTAAVAAAAGADPASPELTDIARHLQSLRPPN